MLKEKYQILLVEDDKVDQLAFSRVLKQKELDYDYFIASSISEAKAMLASNSVDLVICDFLLDDGTAFDIFDHCGHLPVIVTTGAGEEEIAVRAMKMGAYDYLIKDHERKYLEVLPLTLKNAIRQHQADRKIKLLSHAIMNIKD